MAGVVRSMDAAMKSMNLEKVRLFIKFEFKHENNFMRILS